LGKRTFETQLDGPFTANIERLLSGIEFSNSKDSFRY
jgi:hypothetical protein